MHAYLYIGTDIALRRDIIQLRLESLGVSPFDLVTPLDTGANIGIEEIRSFIQALSLVPNQNGVTAGVIHDAERLTIEAQAALLKTLEEPPPHTNIILGVSNSTALLPTIVSRCAIEHIKTTTNKVTGDIYNRPKTPGALVTFLSHVAQKKDEYQIAYDNFIHAIRRHVLHDGNTQETLLLHKLLKARRFISNNVHPLSLLEMTLLDKAIPIRYNDS